MKPRSKRIIDGTELELLRPLLSIPKAELLTYLKVRKIRFREDATNAVAEASRNKLRLRVLPLIEELLGPSFQDRSSAMPACLPTRRNSSPH